MTVSPPSPVESPPLAHDPYSALRQPSVRLYLGGNLIASIGYLMKDTAVGWEVYHRTGSMATLGAVGLVQAVPVVLLPLLTGHVADRFNRKWIVAISLLMLAFTAIVLAINSFWIGSVPLIFACLLLHGITRAFQQPARQAILPQIATPDTFPNAVTWGSGGFHLAQVLGPIAATSIISKTENAGPVYIIYAVLSLTFFVLLRWVQARPTVRDEVSAGVEDVIGGVRFLSRNRMLVTVMSIDLFAVLLGGATGLLPVFQRDLLKVDVWWLGWMRAAPAMGAVAVSFAIAHRSPIDRAGRAMLLAVAGYALATVVFGLAESLWVAMAALIFSGACDIVSVVVRHTMIQTLTPDSMRGRVSALNGMFIGASNYLGDAEAGYVAHWIGPRMSVVTGGIGSLFVALAAAWASPQLVRYGRMDIEPDPDEPLKA